MPGELPEALDLQSLVLGGWTRLNAPNADTPFWREDDGTRHSYGSLRCGLDDEAARRLRDAHLSAIRWIAAAALEASATGDRRDAARLARAAARLCGEIAGLWSPSAVEVPRH
jgi:hypothetical protein